MKRGVFRLILFLLCAVCALQVCPSAVAEDAFAQRGVFDFALVEGAVNVNVRTGPGTEYPWVAAQQAGSWVGLVGEYGSWYQVYLPETGQYGYMSKNYLKRAGGTGAVTGVVNNPRPTQFLNLRAAPSYDARVLNIYYNGAAFTVLSSADGWYQVQIDGLVGYFRKEYVALNGGGSAGTAYVRSQNGGKVNLRSAPVYSGSGVIGQYAPGTQVTVLLSSSVSGSFWKVSAGGAVGYMDSRFLTTASPQPVQPANPSRPAVRGTAVVKNPRSSQFLNLRAQPSTSARVIAQYKNGVKFEVIQAGETWTKVYGSASGNIGYFMTKYLTLTGASFSRLVQNGNSYVNLRSAPSKESGRVYTRVPSGATVTVLIPGDEWTKVRYGGTTGYMMTVFLK